MRRQSTSMLTVGLLLAAGLMGCRDKQQPAVEKPEPAAGEPERVEFPYDIDKRPMPTGEDLDSLLPKQVGPFVRRALRPPYAEYVAGTSEVFVEIGIAEDAADAVGGIIACKEESEAESPVLVERYLFAVGNSPNYFWCVTEAGAFMSWTRGRYFFMVRAKGGESELDRFMKSFPY